MEEERKVIAEFSTTTVTFSAGGGSMWKGLGGCGREGRKGDVEGIVLPVLEEAVAGAHILPPRLAFSAILRKLLLL